MEIKLTQDISAAARVEMHGPVSRKPAAPADSPSFVLTQRLDEAMANVPEIRPEVVERAKGLVNQVQYPPVETMRKIARLLAMETERNS